MDMPVEPKKESRTGAIVGTVAAILLCGLPGLCVLCPAGVLILANMVNDQNINIGVNVPQGVGAAFLCLSVIFIVIAVLVPVLTLRKKKVPADAAVVDVLPPQEPLPPAS